MFPSTADNMRPTATGLHRVRLPTAPSFGTIDFNLRNYTIADLEKFFKLDPHVDYKKEEIEERTHMFHQVLTTSPNVKKEHKRNILEFLQGARSWLISAKFPHPSFLHERPPQSKQHEALIDKPVAPFAYVNTGEHNKQYFAGTLNPLDKRTVKRHLVIDTRLRPVDMQLSTSGWTLHLSEKLTKVVELELKSFEIPMAFYGLSATYGNSHFFVHLTYTSVDGTQVVQEQKVFTLPDGNYSPFKFIDLVNSVLRPTNEDGTLYNSTDMFNYIQLSLALSEDGSGTGRVTFQTTADALAANILEFRLEFARDQNGDVDTKTPLSTRMGVSLGFQKASYTGGVLYTGETMIEPASVRYFYVVVDDFNTQYVSSFVPMSYDHSLSGMTAVLGRVVIKLQYFSIITENSVDTEPRRYFGPVDISKLRIQLLDDHGRPFHINSANFSVALTATQLYNL